MKTNVGEYDLKLKKVNTKKKDPDQHVALQKKA